MKKHVLRLFVVVVACSLFLANPIPPPSRPLRLPDVSLSMPGFGGVPLALGRGLARIASPVDRIADTLSGTVSSAVERALRAGQMQATQARAEAPDTPAPPRAPAPADNEVLSRRTRDSKVFLNDDGTYTATFGQSLHYESSPGVWEDVDLTFRRDGSDYVMDRHDVVVRVVNNEIRATDRRNGKGVAFRLGANVGVDGRRVSFQGPFGLTWSYYTTKAGLKLVATVSERTGKRTYAFPFRVLGNGSLVADSSGRAVGDGFAMPRPVAIGADGQIYDVGAWKVEQSRLVFDFDDSTLPAAAFPYEIDPTTTFSVTAGANDGHVYRDGTVYPPGTPTGSNSSANYMMVARKKYSATSYYVTNSLVRWDTSSLPDLATVISGSLRLFVETKHDDDGRVLTGDWYTAWPIDDSDYTATAMGGASPSQGWDISSMTVGAVNAFTTYNLSNISTTGYTGLRLHINGGQPSGLNQLNLSTMESTANQEPRLVVTYSDPAPTRISRSVSPATVQPGQSVTFTVAWEDPGDQVKAVVCKTNAATPASCPGGAWAIGSFSPTSPSTATYTATTADHGVKSAFLFACDQAACSTNDWIDLVFTVNRPPTVSGFNPPNGAIGASLAPALSVLYGDPDSDTGHVEFEVSRASDGVVVASGSGPNVGAGTTTSWTVPADVLVEGVQYRWRARAHDGFEYSAWSTPVTYLPDVTAPAGPLTQPGNEALVSGIVQLAASPTDANGVASVKFYVRSLGRRVLVATDTSATGGWTGSFDSRAFSDGRAIVEAEYVDVAGNTSCCAAGASASVIVDNAQPAPEPWAGTVPADSIALGESDGKVVLGTGQLVLGAPDVHVAGPGFNAELERGYNSGSSSAGILGPGWRASIEDVLVPSFDGSVTHVDGAGREHRFTPTTVSSVATSFWNNTALSGAPVATRYDDDLDFDWGAAPPESGVNADGWSARWSGLLNVPSSGSWTFSVTSDDGARLLVDGAYVINNWKTQTATEVSGTIALASGLHEITMEYFDGTGPASAVLAWEGPSTSKQTVPSSAFRRVSGFTAQAGVYDALARNADGTHTLTTTDGVTVRFDTAGRRDRVTDRNGNTLSTVYDTAGRPLRVCINAITCAVEDAAFTLVYDANGKLESVADGEARTWWYDYDANGRLWTVTDPLDEVTTFAYDAAGRLDGVEDAELDEARATYDANGRVATLKDPDAVAEAGPATTFAYDTVAREVTVVSAHANSATPPAPGVLYELGTSGELLQVTDELGHVSSYQYDAMFNRVVETDPRGKSTTRTHDARGNVLTETDPGGKTTTYTYYPSGDRHTETDPEGHTTTWTYDGAGNVTSETDAMNHTKESTYYPNGQKHTDTDERDKTTTYTYYPDGNVETVTDPLGNTTTFTYHVSGGVLTEIDAEGDTTTRTFDVLGRMLSETDGEGGKTTYTYDGVGRLETTVGAMGNVAGADPSQYRTTITYDGLGRVATETDPLGNTTTMAYDWNGNLVSQTDARLQETEFRYDVAGRLVERVNADETSVVYTYDELDRVATVTDPRGTATPQQLDDFTTTYTYDDNGNVSSVEDAAGSLTTYTYDDTGKLETTTDPAGNVQGAVPGSYKTTNEYNDAGMLTKVTAPAGITMFGYDAAGNQTSVTDPAGVSTTFEYDDLGRETRRETAGSTSGSASGTLKASGPATADTTFTMNTAGTINAALNWAALATSATKTSTGGLGGGGNATVDLPVHGESILENSISWVKGATTVNDSFSSSLPAASTVRNHTIDVDSTHAPITASLDWTPYPKPFGPYTGSVLALESKTHNVDAAGPGNVTATLDWSNAPLTDQTHLKLELVNGSGTVVASDVDGVRPASVTYYSAGSAGYALRATSMDLGASYTLNATAPAYADLNLELLGPSGNVVASDTDSSRPATISHTPAGTGTFTLRVTSAANTTPHYWTTGSHPVLRYPEIDMQLRDASGDIVEQDSSESGAFSLSPYVAANPGGSYSVRLENLSSWGTTSYTFASTMTRSSTTTKTGALVGPSTSQTVESAGPGTIGVSLDWSQGQITASQQFNSSVASGGTTPHAMTVTSTHVPITGTLSWPTYGEGYTFNGAIDALGSTTREFVVEGPGLVTATLDWANSTSSALTPQTHLKLELLHPSGTVVASDVAGVRPASISYNAGTVGTYKLRVTSSDLAATFTLNGVRPVYADLDLELLDPAGTLVASSTSRPASITHTPAGTGTYTFRVRSVEGPSQSYTLNAAWPVWAYADLVAKLYDPNGVLKQTTSGRPGIMFVPNAVQGTYRVDVVNNTTGTPVPSFELEVYAPTARFAEADVQLLDGSGAVLAETSGSGGRPKTLTYANAPAGTYKLRAIARTYEVDYALSYSVPEAQVLTRTYYDDGQLKTLTDATGTETFFYDAANRLDNVLLPGNLTQDYEYFADGQIKKVTDITGSKEFTYDRVGRVATEKDQAQVLTQYQYDAVGNQTVITRVGTTVTFGYDDLNRLETRTSSSGTTTFTYGDLVNLTKIASPSGVVDQFAYDAVNQFDTLEFLDDATSTPRLDVGFAYDPQGSRKQRIDYNVSGSPVTVAQYDYDGADRLVSETFNVAGAPRTQTYAFDARGNRTLMTSATGNTTYAYNTAGQLMSATAPSGAPTAYFYDSVGNLSKVSGGAGVTAYSWTPQGRLASIAAPNGQATTFTYDAAGLRKTKTSGGTTKTASYDQGRLVQEVSPLLTVSYKYDVTGAPLAIKIGSSTYTYHFDETGSVTEITDASRVVRASYTYDAWGNIVAQTGTASLLNANPYTYRGKYRVRYDRETGLYLMGARYYDPTTGRFISRDPADDMVTESSYTYANGNPIANIDPNGYAVQSDGGVGSGTDKDPVSPQALSLTAEQRRHIFKSFFRKWRGNTANPGNEKLGFGAGPMEFLRWEIGSRRIRETGRADDGSRWWRGVNGMMALDMKAARSALAKSVQSGDRPVREWMKYAARARAEGRYGPIGWLARRVAQQKQLWEAHQRSLHRGIRYNQVAFRAEGRNNPTELQFMKLAVEVVDRVALAGQITDVAPLFRRFLKASYPDSYPATTEQYRLAVSRVAALRRGGHGITMSSAGNVGTGSTRW